MAIPISPEPLLLVVRAYYGFSQTEVAEFLGVSRGQVALVETGRRLLSSVGEKRLRFLSTCLSNFVPSQAEMFPFSAPTAWEPLQCYQRKCLRQAHGLRQELARLQMLAMQCQRRLQDMPVLRAALAQELPTADLQTWLHQREEQAHAGLTECGPAAQALLQMRINTLESQAADATRKLGAIRRPLSKARPRL
ncbi:hypothetical protein [Hymenobacter metallicola]|uniref:HTH cro/C1-type domain-containing protein n=1 Tax=Hymenobacter metallicola TaxID=2563114 RepID=A0A4Z0Q182_9BACT|nr:hypothetical protein [Hymenobacter metallicola]TGE22923.1 hypothetical protein E5K02_21405 [Hymenobacter metallicola]